MGWRLRFVLFSVAGRLTSRSRWAAKGVCKGGKMRGMPCPCKGFKQNFLANRGDIESIITDCPDQSRQKGTSPADVMACFRLQPSQSSQFAV